MLVVQALGARSGGWGMTDCKAAGMGPPGLGAEVAHPEAHYRGSIQSRERIGPQRTYRPGSKRKMPSGTIGRARFWGGQRLFTFSLGTSSSGNLCPAWAGRLGLPSSAGAAGSSSQDQAGTSPNWTVLAWETAPRWTLLAGQALVSAHPGPGRAAQPPVQRRETSPRAAGDDGQTLRAVPQAPGSRLGNFKKIRP